MATIKSFEELEIWQIARELAKRVKKLTETELFCKDYRFRDQTNASAGSVMDNIAEGFERSGQVGVCKLSFYAKGSSGEVRSQLYRAVDYGYLEEKDVLPVIREYGSLAAKISGFMQYLNKSDYKGQKFKDRA